MSHDTTQKKIRYLSLFSGIGGFELGIQQAYENIWNKSRGEQSKKKWKHNGGSFIHTESELIYN